MPVHATDGCVPGPRNESPIRCLIVEDDGLIALDLRFVLEDRGARVVGTAATGARAIALAETLAPDVVLMDIRLQGEPDGIDAARVIIDRFAIPVVFVSGHDDSGTRARIAALNGPQLVLKPIYGDEIDRAVRRACNLPPARR